MLPERVHRTPMECLGGVVLLAGHLGDLVEGEVSDVAEQEHVALARGGGDQQVVELPRAEVRDRLVLERALRRAAFEVLVLGGIRRAGAGAPTGIDHPVMGDREHPRAERGLIALEAVQVTDDLEEGLGGDVLRRGAALPGEVAGEHRGEIEVELRPGCVVTTASSREQLVEALPEHATPWS